MKISFSSIKRFNECPRKFQLHDIEGMREDSIGSALVFGQAIDVALNEMILPTGKVPEEVFLAAMDTFVLNKVKEDLTTSMKVNYYISDIDISLFNNQPEDVQTLLDYRTARDNGGISEEIQLRFNMLARRCIKERGIMMLDEYRKTILPTFKRVLEVQKFFSIDNGDSDELIGFIDLVAELHDGTIVIFDNKTSKDAYKDDSVKLSEQLATYKEAMIDKYPTARSGFITIQKKVFKRDPKIKIQVIIDDIDKAFTDKVFNDYDSAMVNIKKGNFTPNYKSCEDARGFKCQFFKLCHDGNTEGLINMKAKSEKK